MSDADRTLDERRRSDTGPLDGAASSASAPALSSGAVRAAGGRSGADDVKAPDFDSFGNGFGNGFGNDDRVLGAGERCGEYVVDGLIGEGAFGSVYRGVHLLIGKPAAIKVLSLRHSVDPGIVARFVDEARAVNKIHHDGIIDIFGFGRLDDGRQYYVMELLAGRTLQEHLLLNGALPPAEVLALLRPVADALTAAHDKGIAHRDVKPANIFLVDVPGSDGKKVKLLDFGIAKLGVGSKSDGPVDGDGGKARTDAGAVVGTPAYMSPEQCLARPVDHRADIYAIGVVAYEMLTGRRPFERSSSFELMHDHVHVPLPRARELVPALPAAVDDALAVIAAKDPTARPASARAAVDLLAAALGGKAVARPTTSTTASTTAPTTATKTKATGTTTTSAEPVRSKTSTTLAAQQNSKLALFVAAGALVVAGIAVGAVVTQHNERPPPPPWQLHDRPPPPDGPPNATPNLMPNSMTNSTPNSMTTASTAPASAAVDAGATVGNRVEVDVRGIPPDGDVVEGDTVLRRGNGVVLLTPGVHTLTLRGPGLKDFTAVVDTAKDARLHVPGGLQPVHGGGHRGPPRDGPDDRPPPPDGRPPPPPPSTPTSPHAIDPW